MATLDQDVLSEDMTLRRPETGAQRGRQGQRRQSRRKRQVKGSGETEKGARGTGRLRDLL